MASNEYGTTWWGRRWLNALSGIDYENRIPRGKDYADAGKVPSLRIDEEKGEVKARVTGHYDPFYGVKIALSPIDKSDVARLVDRLAESPLIVARLAAGELSPEIADIAESLGIRIFPTSWKDLEMSCTCPDWAVPCKHIAAAIYKLSEEIDANPFLLFTLRGIDLIAERCEAIPGSCAICAWAWAPSSPTTWDSARRFKSLRCSKNCASTAILTTNRCSSSCRPHFSQTGSVRSRGLRRT